MPRTTLALKFGLYMPAIIGVLFLSLNALGEQLDPTPSGLSSAFDVAPGVLAPSVLVFSYLAFGLPAFMTGAFAATFGARIVRWDVYQVACASLCGLLSGAGHIAFVWSMGAITAHDKALFFVAAFSGATAAAFCARWTRAEHEEAMLSHAARHRARR
jgi:hypothetical protein